jgi:membrane-associated phospholipid phosphatase
MTYQSPHPVTETDTPVAKPRRHYRAFLFQAYLAIAILIFLVLAVLAKTVAYFTFDVTITRAIQAVGAGGFGSLMDAVSWIGFAPQVYVLTLAIIVWLYLGGLKWESIVLALSVIGSSVLGVAIKVVIERPRPSVDLVNVVAQLNSYSFPSGHVLYFTTFFGFLLFLAYVLLEHSWWRTVALMALGGLIALVGVSRIYEGQHWASDVLAAYLLGSVCLSASILVYRRGKRRSHSAVQGGEISSPGQHRDEPAPL